MSNLENYIPEGRSWLRAAISSVPVAGGALNHLLFDKADSIRQNNIESAVAALSEQVAKLGEQAIDKDWFSSEEALAAFKILSERASYEPDKEKVKSLGKLIATCGTKEYSHDKRKFSVIEHLSKLSYVQIKLIEVVLSTPTESKNFKLGDFEQTASAIWLSSIVNSLNSGPKFWDGDLAVDQELEILESLNAVRRVQLMGPTELGFALTAIGLHAATYVKSAEL